MASELSKKNSSTAVQPLPCAWCNDEMKIPQGEGSHGICERHDAEMHRQLEQIRAERKAGRV